MEKTYIHIVLWKKSIWLQEYNIWFQLCNILEKNNHINSVKSFGENRQGDE